MKKLWVNAVPYKKQVVITALESGTEAVVLPDYEVKQKPEDTNKDIDTVLQFMLHIKSQKQ